MCKLEDNGNWVWETKNKTKKDKKWIEPKGPVGHHQVHQPGHFGSHRKLKEREMGIEDIWRNNDWKILKLNRSCE